MEVHTHTHTPRKKWTHYFWEFLMLFLAVFCGFLAEYQLEHKIEKERAGQLAINLYAEVYADSIAIQQILELRLIKEKYCIDFATYIRDSSLTKPSENFYRSFAGLFIIHRFIFFEPKEGILNQLTNSGSLRYFKSNQLQDEIGSLSVAISNVRNRIAREVTFLDFTMRPFQQKHFDSRWMEEISNNGKLTLPDAINQKNLQVYSKPRVLNIEQFNRTEAENIAYNALFLFRGTRQFVFKAYAEANHKLLETLRKAYHLK